MSDSRMIVGGPCSACNAWREFDPWHPCTRCHKPLCNKCARFIMDESVHVCPSCVAAEKAKALECPDCDRAECEKHTKKAPPPKPWATCRVRVRRYLSHAPTDYVVEACGSNVGDGLDTCPFHDEPRPLTVKPRATCTVTVFGMAAQSGRPCGAPAVESGPHGAWCADHWGYDLKTGRPVTLADVGFSLHPVCAQGEYATLAARQREPGTHTLDSLKAAAHAIGAGRRERGACEVIESGLSWDVRAGLRKLDPLAREYAELHDHAAALRRGCDDLRGDIQRERRVLATYLRNREGLAGLDAAKAKAVDSLVVAGGYKRDVATALVEEWTAKPAATTEKKSGRIARARAWLNDQPQSLRHGLASGLVIGCANAATVVSMWVIARTLGYVP